MSAQHNVRALNHSLVQLALESDFLPGLLQSLLDNNIFMTSTDFVSDTSSEITTSKVTEEVITMLYENVRLKLVSIRPAESEPQPVTEAEPASIFIGSWLISDSPEEDN